MDIKEAAKRLNKSEPTIRRMIKDGRLKATMVNGRWNISDSDLIDLTNDQSLDQIVIIDQMRREIDHLRDQIDQKDRQIDQLQQLLMVSQTNLATHQKLLGYYQEPFWKRWFGKKRKMGTASTV